MVSGVGSASKKFSKGKDYGTLWTNKREAYLNLTYLEVVFTHDN